MVGLRNTAESFDAYQQRHAWLGFPIAVARKFSDDRAGSLAAVIAYYAFISIFPLLLVLVVDARCRAARPSLAAGQSVGLGAGGLPGDRRHPAYECHRAAPHRPGPCSWA